MEKITGKNNDIIKGVKKLLTSSKQRRAQSQFVLEGARLVFDVLNSFVDVDSFFITESAYDKYRDALQIALGSIPFHAIPFLHVPCSLHQSVYRYRSFRASQETDR